MRDGVRQGSGDSSRSATPAGKCYIAGISVKIPAVESPTELLSFISVTAPNAKVELKRG